MPKEMLYSKKQGEENKYKYLIFYTPPFKLGVKNHDDKHFLFRAVF